MEDNKKLAEKLEETKKKVKDKNIQKAIDDKIKKLDKPITK